MYKPRNMLVTGGAGFIGANFIHGIIKQYSNIQVINLDKLTYAGSRTHLEGLSNPEQHIFVEGDICNGKLVSQLLEKYHIDTIVHFAAESHVDRSITGPAAFVQTNIIGTFTLLEAARQHKCRFHHISTDEVYGTLNKTAPAFTETTSYAPNSPYSASKAGSDHLVRAYYHTYGLPVTTTNCSNNYGPYQHTEKFIPTVIRACIEKKPIPVYGDGSNIRDWLYVDDHCRGIMRVIERGKLGETYNIGGWNEWTNLALVKKICELMDVRCPEHAPHEKLLQFVTDRPGHDWRYAINANRMKDELDWVPEETFETGILKTLDYEYRRYHR
ncbi:MAG: dTDP-glucose 4,6-dehydratase [Gammaproteobacteria bacterium]